MTIRGMIEDAHRIVREAPADPGLLADLAEIRGAELDGD